MHQSFLSVSFLKEGHRRVVPKAKHKETCGCLQVNATGVMPVIFSTEENCDLFQKQAFFSKIRTHR